MNTVTNYFKMILAFMGGVFGWFWGEIDPLFCSLVSFIVLDYLTGVILAISQKKLSSEIGYRGILRKAMIFALLGIGNVIDNYIMSSGSAVRTMLIMFYLSNEGISILENVANLGLPLPQKIKDILLQIDKIDE